MIMNTSTLNRKEEPIALKKVLSVSLGSSTRDHSVETEFLGEKFFIERIGTNGDMDKAIKIIQERDGLVDAFGLGGIDMYIYAAGKRYMFRDAARIAKAAKRTPVVDGSGLKNTLERRVISYLQDGIGMNFSGKKVLMVSAVDRPGMARSLWEAGANMNFGDLIFGLGIPVGINSIKSFDRLTRVLVPIVVKLPFKMLYPTGEKQESVSPKYGDYYNKADIIAGDFHFIRRYMPQRLEGKCIITNTVTQKDIDLLKERGVSLLITTTPELNGRSFGTNVMEGVLVALAGKAPDQMTEDEYSQILERVGFKPRIIDFSAEQAG